MHAHGAEDFTEHGPALSIYSLIIFLVSWPSPGVLSLYPLNPLLYRPSMKIGCADRRLFSKISRWINRHIGMEWNGFAGRFPPLLAVTMTSIHMRLVLQLFSIDFLTEYKMHVYGISGYLCYFIFQLKWAGRILKVGFKLADRMLKVGIIGCWMCGLNEQIHAESGC